MKLMDWVTDRTLPYLAAASACTAASSGYSRAGMKGRSRFYCALSVLWLGLTAYDIWSTHREEAADATDGNDWEHWDESDLGTAAEFSMLEPNAAQRAHGTPRTRNGAA